MSQTTKKIASIIGNPFLSASIERSVSIGLKTPFVNLPSGKTVWDLFKRSLDAAIRDIEEHPKGKLFRRLIEYGPHDPDDPEAPTSDGETTLSDPECGICVEFIFSHMVARFKGELAELLAIEPCIALVSKLKMDGCLPSNVHIYWGEMIQERKRTSITKTDNSRGGFTKGADGLLLQNITKKGQKNKRLQKVLGIFEVKSMNLGRKKILDQIQRHIMRLKGGVRLGDMEYIPVDIKLDNSDLLRIMVMPSRWGLSRVWHSEKTERGRSIVIEEATKPSIENQVEELSPNLWRITLAWSQEALEQAAYEMTVWYLAQIGKHIYLTKNLPKGWEHMTPEEAGHNSIKMMLYYINLRYLSERHLRITARLYNIYCFTYPLGRDSKEMLWPQDFPDKD